MRDRIRSWDDLQAALAQSRSPECIAVFCGSQYPGNLGSSIRACALLGVKWVCVLERLEWRFIQTAFRAAQLEREEAAAWEVRLVQAPMELSQAEALTRLRDVWGFKLVGLTDAPAAVPIWRAELSHPRTVLVFGKETGGIPAGVEPLLDIAATVPQTATGCLNVGHAVAVTVYERHRQTEQRGQPDATCPDAKRRRSEGPTAETAAGAGA